MKLRFCIVSMLLLATLTAQAAEIRVAAASDLSFAIKEIISNFEQTTGNKILLTLGSSGNFYAQIQNGAPFQVFLSADAEYPKKLEADGKTEPGSAIVYGFGRIVVWVSRESKLDLQKLQMNALLDPSIRKIAIANPDHAPYGRAAVAAMQHSGIYDLAKSRLVLGESVSQTAQFLESGAADIGIVALSLAVAPPMSNEGRYWTIPSEMYPRMEQSAVLVKGAGAESRHFIETLRGDKARAILQRYGFELPPK
jgi:molybdate transport system substrate-binding protein